ncbi:hypothetical protein [Psychromonas arctica]|uniref:hypothetical protein n=1 Tax=Psychromonas arctica TaxID=168275 RepID=UPI002FD25F48
MLNKQISISKIQLDILNPRHDASLDTQEKIIKHLIDKENIKNLAKDIAVNGLSPIDTLAVIEDESNTGKYIVVEGNRRICALTLLNRPQKHKPTKDFFAKLQENGTLIPQKVRCTVFENREAADIWIERRHSGEQEGKGTTQWDAEQKSRFNIRRGKADKNALATSLLVYGQQQGYLPENLENKILTTVTRYVSNPYFRNTIGLRSKSSSPEILIDVEVTEFDRVIKIFLQDALENQKVTSRHDVKKIGSYARSLIENEEAPKKRLKNAIALMEQATNDEMTQSTSSSSKSQKPNRAPRDSAHPNKRTKLIPQSFTAQIPNATLRRAYGELKSISVDEQTLGSTLVFRVFLELLYERYHFKMQGNHTEMDTNRRIGKISAIIEQDEKLTKLEKNALAALKRIQSQGHLLSPKTLGANAHGGYYPTANDLKIEWDNIAEIIRYMLNKIAEE